jgi:DNA replication protein DnaC
MKTVGSAATTMAQDLLERREDDRRSLSALASEAGGAAEWLSLIGLKDSPDDLTTEELVSETQVFWQDAAVRERNCERCPEYGGACARELSCFERGTYLVWEERLPKAKRCTRWNEYVIRERLAECGVPFRLQGMQVTTFQCANESLGQAHLEATELVKCCVVNKEIPSGSAWLLLCGDHGKGKSHLMVAALRTVRQARPAARVWYQDCVALERELRATFDDKQAPDPLLKLREAKLLALDTMNPSQWKPWFQKEIETLLRERWDAGLATMMASNDRRDVVERALASLSRFSDEAAICTLT